MICKKINIFLIFFLSAGSNLAVCATLKPDSLQNFFRFHLSQAPLSLNPQLQRANNGNYLLNNLFRNLLRVDPKGNLIPELAQECHRMEPQKIKCQLRKNLKWSDGTPLTAADFLRSYKTLLDPKTKASKADLLFSVKNAAKIYKGQAQAETLGVKTPDPMTLVFELEENNVEFEWNLAHIVLSPIRNEISGDFNKAKDLIANGPYRILNYDSHRGFTLTSNTYFWDHNPQRPLVEALIIAEESVAVHLFEKKELDFLRRLPTLLIEKYQHQKEFLWQENARNDFIAFGPSLLSKPLLRKALSLSLQFSELQKILHSEGSPPGCMGLPDFLYLGATPCLQFNGPQAKQSLQKEDLSKGLVLTFSNMGGDDHRRTMEWAQEQWRKNLGIKVEVIGKENKTFTEEIQNKPPDLFRRGLAPEKLTCSSFLESFTSGHPDNSQKLSDALFDKMYKDVSGQEPTLNKTRTLCHKALKHLLDSNYIIPLGKIHFSMLLNSAWRGVELNMLNQLNLSQLRSQTSK